MGLLSDTKTGEDVWLLGSGREIARTNLWAVRFIVGVLLVSVVLSNARSGVGTAANGGEYIIGALLGSAVLYWVGLKLLSSSTEEETNTNVQRM